MKISKASYVDDGNGPNIPGVLVKRFLRKPVFYAADPSCGWDRQVIIKANRKNVIDWTEMDRFLSEVERKQKE